VKLRLLKEAEDEAQLASLWYDSRLVGLGDEFLEILSGVLSEIARRPEQFGKLESVQTTRNIRRVLLQKFPYLVVYEILEDEAIVLAISHASQRPGYWLSRPRGA
jgi:hypothetical protein